MLFQRKPITKEERAAALKQAIKLWQSGKRQRAVELYKRYGITDAQFMKLLVAYMHSNGRK